MNRTYPVDITLGMPTSVASYESRAAVVNWVRLAFVILLSLVVALLFLRSTDGVALAVLVTGLVILIPLLWRKPALGLYILLGAAVTIESFALHFPDSFTDAIPFFRGMAASHVLPGVDLSPAELLMVLVLALCLLRGLMSRNLHFDKGPIFVPFTAYILVVSIGALYGMTTGGDAVTALWEIRAQFYAYVCYLLAFNLLKNRGQAKIVMWIIILGIGFKSLVGIWRFLVTLHGDRSLVSVLTDYNSILSHEESYFFALFIVLVAVLFLFRGTKWQKRASLLLLAPIIVAFLANERRVGMIVLAIGLALLMLFTFAMLRDRRPLVMTVAVVACLVLPLYFVAFWSSDTLVAQPVRAVRSITDPFDRDYASNIYREGESYNIHYNIRQNPIVGTGYGKPMATPWDLPDVSQMYSWWNIMPHDNILWVWMRLGTVGFIVFWFFVGSTLVRGCFTARNLDDRWLKGFAVFAIIGVVGLLMLSATDMGLVNFRLMVYFGILVGLMFRLPGMDKSAGQQAQERTG